MKTSMNEFDGAVNEFLTESTDTEVAEEIVNSFLDDQKINKLLSPEFREDTLSADIATIPIGFKPVGLLAPTKLAQEKKKRKVKKGKNITPGLDLSQLASIMGSV